VIAIDDKTLRRSHNRASRQGAIHLVSVWSMSNRLALGQVKVDGKSNEITATPELLRLLHIEVCILTIAAAGAQKEIAELICAQGAGYSPAFKDDRPMLLSGFRKYELWPAPATTGSRS
jgi:hypothetical protein